MGAVMWLEDSNICATMPWWLKDRDIDDIKRHEKTERDQNPSRERHVIMELASGFEKGVLRRV